MAWASLLAVTICGLHLILWVPLFWRFKQPMAILFLALVAMGSGVLFGSAPTLGSLLYVILSGYLCINLLKVIKARLHADNLYYTTRKTALIIVLSQVAIIAVHLVQVRAFYVITILGIVQLLLGAALLIQLGRTFKAIRQPGGADEISNRDLPALTVAIPARNETDDLEACLESLIASSYPKLEIIVLDDCSQNRHTPEIIRNYAHEGVRFIAGKVPPDNWLAKNYAYQQLSQAANSNLILFCGVDVRFAPNALTEMVKVMVSSQKTMLSFLPNNELPRQHRLLSYMAQANRYAWELVWPRQLFGSPPVLSTCWLIDKHRVLDAAGGFEAVRHTVLPERYFARQADGYAFISLHDKNQLRASKQYEAQLATAIRTRYPQLHRRPELVAAASITEVLMGLGPLVVALYSLLAGYPALFITGALGKTLVVSTYYLVGRQTYRRATLRGLCLAPVAVLYDVAVLNYSLWQYEFREVIWKGRNICLPAFQVVPRLPKLK